ncbi:MULTISPECIES: NAD-dependent epimerase/dehydratase family protein [Actinomadura]|uniref:NAD-dependent epimerase/dehydratase family protein n=1 Tax=Actinomadura yumaensis TaxID=111807 RepID=A0ABW2CFK8_9ACTN|nr:NAD(P)-dependent oxidoreductase [Actinomadura sp. J1-007]MWK34440.1 NAD-dependent epimerase/dehydratase family protein [Actinomadura sp. J1-007]
MKILVAGATGVVGRRLLPLLAQAGHEVAGTTRSADRAGIVSDLHATPVVMDALDAGAVRDAVAAQRPDVIVHQLTDLSGEDFEANSHLRVVGTRNLVDAAKAEGVETMIAQSIAWVYVPSDAPAVESDPLDPTLPPSQGVIALENAVAEMPRGVVLRYGALYGPGTWYAKDGAIAERVRAGNLALTPAWTSFVHVDDAASAALAALDWPSGPVNVVDDEPATTAEWLPVYCEALGAPMPGTARHAAATGRPASNAKALGLGWKPQVPTWRTGFAETA